MNNKVAIIGLGYVGLPLAILCHQKGFDVTGIDIDQAKINLLSQGISYLADLSDGDIQEVAQSPKFNYTTDFGKVNNVDTMIICVPTPLSAQSEPNLNYLHRAIEQLLPHLKQHQLVVVESSTYPGTTEEVIKPKLEGNGWKVGHDLFLGYSPERIDPGNQLFSLENIPKVISGVTESCLEALTNVYQDIFRELVPVKSTRVAEMTKIVENTQRFINISFMNELSRISEKLDVDIWEVVTAASTKPYGFTPYFPGPGIGGHCIPVDPLYLKWKAEQLGVKTEFIDLAKKINDKQPDYIVERIRQIVKHDEAKLLTIGLTYKKDINDIRESASIPVFQRLVTNGYQVDYHDPFIESFEFNGHTHPNKPLSAQMLSDYDGVIILTDHSQVNYALIKQHAKLIFDTRNKFQEVSNTIYKL